MSTFDSATKITRAVADPVTDHKLPDPKSLSWKTITAPTALAGTKGAHCELSHGDVWQQIGGPGSDPDRIVNIVGNDVLTISNAGIAHNPMAGNQTITIDGDVQFTVNPNGSFTETEYGPVNWTFFMPENGNRYADFALNQPNDCSIQHKHCDNESIFEQFSFVNFQMDLCTYAHVEVATTHAEVKVAHAEAKGAHAEVNFIHAAHDFVNMQDRDAENTTSEIRGWIQLLLSDTSNIMMSASGMEMHFGVEQHLGVEGHEGAAFFSDINGVGIVVP